MRADQGAGAQVERSGRSDGFPKDRLGYLLKALRSYMEVLKPKTQLFPSKWFLGHEKVFRVSRASAHVWVLGSWVQVSGGFKMVLGKPHY